MTTSLSETVCRPQLGLAMINLSTKFEVSQMFTHYKDTKGNAKYRNLGGFQRLGVNQVIGSITIRQNACYFLSDFSRNYAPILYRWQVICRKSRILTYATCIWHPHWGDFEFRRNLWHQETSVLRLSCRVIHMILSLAVLTQYQYVTDRWSDRQTHDDSIYCASIASAASHG